MFRNIKITTVKNSISFKIMVILVSITILVMIAFGVFNFYIEKNRAESSLKSIAYQTMERVSNSLVYPIWVMDDTEIKRTMVLEMADMNIQAIILRNNKKKFYMGLIRDNDWAVIDYQPTATAEAGLSNLFLSLKHKILKNKVVIGYIEIYLTDKFLKELLRDLVMRSIVQTIALSTIMIAVLFFSFQIIIFKPLRILKNSVGKYSERDFSARALIISNDEIGRLARTFNTMATELETSFNRIEEQINENKAAYKAREQLVAQLENSNVQLKIEIEERAQAEALLRESEGKHRSLFESAPDGIAIVTLAGQIVSYNQAFMQIFHIDHQPIRPIINLQDFYLNPRQDHEFFLKVLQTDGHLDSYELDFSDLDGRIFPSSLSARLIQYDGQLCIQAIIRDISKIKKMEQDLRDYADNLERMVEVKTYALQSANQELSSTIETLEQTREQLASSAHQAGMAEIAVSVLHNIGNSINSLNVRTCYLAEVITSPELQSLERIADLLKTEGVVAVTDETEKRRKDMLINLFFTILEALRQKNSILNEGFTFLIKTLNHVMEIIAIQQKYAGLRGFESMIDINKLIEDALEMISDSISKRNIALTLELNRVPEVFVYKNKMIQMLINLFKNAYEAIDLNPAAAEKRINIQTNTYILSGKTFVQVTIADTGVGFSSETKTEIFRFGFSTKRRGTGFGLHDTANYVKAQGGYIDIHSEGPGCGARILFGIPVEKSALSTRA